MTRLDEIKRAKRERSRQVLALVEELGSLKAAAAQLGISIERVSQLIGRGAYPPTIEATCQDCGRPARIRRSSPPTCRRCRDYLNRTGRRWTPEVSIGKAQMPSRAQQIRERMRPATPERELIAPAARASGSHDGESE